MASACIGFDVYFLCGVRQITRKIHAERVTCLTSKWYSFDKRETRAPRLEIKELPMESNVMHHGVALRVSGVPWKIRWKITCFTSARSRANGSGNESAGQPSFIRPRSTFSLVNRQEIRVSRLRIIAFTFLFRVIELSLVFHVIFVGKKFFRIFENQIFPF